MRHLSSLDWLLTAAQQALSAADGRAYRPMPKAASVTLPENERQQSVALMRVNHAGEVAAQGLYHGQILTAQQPEVRAHLIEAARDEQDHLVWCDQRLAELGARPSVLSPLWYAGSVLMGAAAGLKGDAVSLAFITETEKQVSEHLADHLERLPAADTASRALLLQMKADEERHGQEAQDHGASTLPDKLPALMQEVSGVMKFFAARV
jgi:ubiquinone biosynthesis monooxygenase Coq7